MGNVGMKYLETAQIRILNHYDQWIMGFLGVLFPSADPVNEILPFYGTEYSHVDVTFTIGGF